MGQQRGGAAGGRAGGRGGQESVVEALGRRGVRHVEGPGAAEAGLVRVRQLARRLRLVLGRRVERDLWVLGSCGVLLR